MNFKVKDQVVVRRGSGPRGHIQTKEVRVGQIAAFADAETAVVSLPLPGGRIEKKEIKVSELEPVAKVYGRSAVQVNPLHRNIATTGF